MRFPILNRVVQFGSAFAILIAITVFYRRILHVNATTVALTFILAILAVSTFWGMAVSVAMSLVAVLVFNYFFLPPVGKLTIADPQNWIALIVFLVVAVLASHLSTRARQKASDASARQRDIEKLYSFSQGLLESRNVMELLTSNQTFVNNRLARHYGIEGPTTSAFKQVTLTDPNRFGLLGKAAVLMRTSYGDRTSPVLRGAWVLDKIIGSPPTPPPPNVATNLTQEPGEAPKTVRARLEQHRDKASCRQCHGVIDPTGLAL